MGGVLWRLDQVCRAAEELSGRPFDFSTAKAANIRQLAARYGDKYSDVAALNRDKGAERAALEFNATIMPPGPMVGKATMTEVPATTGDPAADRLLRELRANPGDGRPDLKAFNPRPEDPSEDDRERPC